MERKSSTSKKSSQKPQTTSLLADIPLGLSSALSRNIDAMRVFAEMPDDKRRSVIEGAHAISSKEEMKAYVANLTQNI